MMVFTSAIATVGRKRQKRQNMVPKSPKLPARVQRSTQVGTKACQLDGRKSRVSEVMMISNRSNHMPTLPHMAATQTTHILLRNRLDHMSWGVTTLQKVMMHQPHQ